MLTGCKVIIHSAGVTIGCIKNWKRWGQALPSFPPPLCLEGKIDQGNCTDNMNVAVINLLTCTDHVVSWLVSYRAWRWKNSFRYWGKRSSKCVRHFVLLSSQHANQFTYPITPCALAVHRTRWRSSGEQVNMKLSKILSWFYAWYLWYSPSMLF